MLHTADRQNISEQVIATVIARFNYSELLFENQGRNFIESLRY